jgi:hypothetical protein
MGQPDFKEGASDFSARGSVCRGEGLFKIFTLRLDCLKAARGLFFIITAMSMIAES